MRRPPLALAALTCVVSVLCGNAAPTTAGRHRKHIDDATEGGLLLKKGLVILGGIINGVQQAGRDLDTLDLARVAENQPVYAEGGLPGLGKPSEFYSAVKAVKTEDDNDLWV